ncbi:UBP9-binding protein [Smittium mucronatum]|uniref:UBP9-binding protein n=1 Tax=Smittium mucronatum TaxID=133383 RepID=A0A1R0GVN9_9FUNG|nr:UBP9-binding protein [Smittium mucronatum]
MGQLKKLKEVGFQYDFANIDAIPVQPNVVDRPSAKPIKRSLAYVIPLDISHSSANRNQASVSSLSPGEKISTSCSHGHILGVNTIEISNKINASDQLYAESGLDPQANKISSIMYTGGRDGAVKAWALSCDNGRTNYNGSIVASGTTDRKIGLWDLRTKNHSGWLSGHTDRVNCVLVPNDSDYILSGSSDNTVKLWSLKTKRCISTFSHHDSSVWTLYSQSPDYSTFFSGDRSGQIMKTNMRDDLSYDINILIAKESNSILKISSDSDGKYLWTASYGSEHDAQNAIFFKEPVYDTPLESIVGPPGLKKHVILQNKRHVLAINSENEISLWDLMLAKKIKTLDNAWGTDLDSIADSMNRPPQTVPSWCNVDTKIGMLTVQMKVTQAWDAEVYVDQLDYLSFQEYKNFISNGVERIKIGPWVLKNIFENFKEFIPDQKVITNSVTNSLSKWVHDNPSGSSMSFYEIMNSFHMSGDQDLLELRSSTPNGVDNTQNETGPNNPDSKQSENQETKNQKSPAKVGRFLSFKIFKNKKEKKSSEDGESRRSNAITMKSGSGSNKNQNSTTSTSSDPEKELQLKNYNLLKEFDKNLITIKGRADGVKSSRSNLYDLYPVHKLPQNLKIIVLEEDTNNEMPSCIYESSIPASGKKFYAYSQHNIIDDPFLTLILSLPSWMVDYIYLHRFPLTYCPPHQLSFALAPLPVDFMRLPSLGLGNNFLSAHQMLRVAKISAYVSEKLKLKFPPSEYFESLVEASDAFSKNHPEESKSLKLSLENIHNENGVIKTLTKIKCYWEIALENSGDSPCDEERVALRALSKLPHNQLPKSLVLTLEVPKNNNETPLNGNTLNPFVQKPKRSSEVQNGAGENSSSNMGSLSNGFEDSKNLNIHSGTLNSPNNGSKEYVNGLVEKDVNSTSPDINLNNTIGTSPGTFSLIDSQYTVDPVDEIGIVPHNSKLKPKPAGDESSSSNIKTAEPKSDVDQSHRMSNLSFLWIEILCKDVVLDPSTTLSTIRTFHWKSSQEMQISYGWKQFIINRIKKGLKY